MHRIIAGTAIAISLLLSQPVTLHAQDKIRDLVVKIHAVHNVPDVLRPWTKNPPQHIKGSGVVIDGKEFSPMLTSYVTRARSTSNPISPPIAFRRASRR